MFFKTPALDATIQETINQHMRAPLLDTLMPILSSHALFYVLLIPLAAWVWRKYGSRSLLLIAVLLLAVGMTDLGTNVIKKSIHRVRPLNALPNTYFVEDGQWERRPADFEQTKENGTSYPSAHGANTMCLAVLSMLFWPALKKWPLLLPLVVGYSRVYLGKHYPTDVVGGWLFGAVIAVAVWLACRRFIPSNSKR